MRRISGSTGPVIRGEKRSQRDILEDEKRFEKQVES